VKNECLFSEITFIAKLLPMIVHTAQDTPRVRKQKLSDYGQPEDQTQ